MTAWEVVLLFMCVLNFYMVWSLASATGKLADATKEAIEAIVAKIGG